MLIKRSILAFFATAIALSLGGCGTTVGNYVGSGVTNFESFVTSPQTQATVKTLSAATVVFICDVSAVANLAGQIEAAAGAGQSTLGTNGKVYAASSAACTGLGGIINGTTTVSAGTAVIQ